MSPTSPIAIPAKILNKGNEIEATRRRLAVKMVTERTSDWAEHPAFACPA